MNAYIPQSGTASMGSSSPGTSAASVTNWSNLSQKLGCGEIQAADITKTLECMRGKSTEAILDATTLPAGQSALGQWGPKVDNKTIFADTLARRNAGQFVHRVRYFFSINSAR